MEGKGFTKSQYLPGWRVRYEERYKRSAPGSFLHLFNRGVEKRRIFMEKDDYQWYLARMETVLKESPLEVLAYCLMPNHVHFLARQLGEQGAAEFFRALHTSYGKHFNAKYRRAGHLFQGRFRQIVVTREVHLRYLIPYIHLNPEEAGLVAHPKDWPWSSWKAYAKGADDPRCNPEPLLELSGGRKEYRRFEQEVRKWKKEERWEKAEDVIME